jgi:hypothetical protein
MIPNIKPTEDILPGAYGRIEEFHDFAVNRAVKEFEKEGRAPFLWIVLYNSSIRFVETPWENDDEKHRSTYMMRELMRLTNARAYSFITEAWVAAFTLKDMSEQERDALLEQTNKHGVRSLPESQREDVMMVSSFNRAGDYGFTRFGIRYGKQRHPTGGWPMGRLLARDDWHTSEMGHWEGRMWNLLKEEE